MSPEEILKLQKTLIECITPVLQEAVANQVDKSVNGKINKLQGTVTDYIREDMLWKATDKAWKEDAQPSIDLGKNVNGFSTIGASLFGVVVGFAAVLTAIYESFQFFGKHK